MDLDCPTCKEPSGIVPSWDNLGEVLNCKHCGQKLQVEYDESYDEDSGEEYGWWSLEKIDS